MNPTLLRKTYLRLVRRNKFGAKRATGSSGRSYASTAERDRAEELRLLERAGNIAELTEQPVVLLAGAVRYRADFRYVEQPSGRVVHEDVKGVIGERFRVVMQLWPAWGPSVLRITKRAGRTRAFTVVREILPKS